MHQLQGSQALMAARYPQAATYTELLNRLAPSTITAIEASVAAAPPLPNDAVEVCTQIFAGAGNRILRARQQQTAA